MLRSASLAASATGDRRRLRGAKWYDPVLYLVGAPWHAVRSIPGTLLLVLWALGLALAAVLVCYAAAASVEVTLFAAGLVLAVSLWLGPGGSRVRGPMSRAVNPLSVRDRHLGLRAWWSCSRRPGSSASWRSTWAQLGARRRRAALAVRPRRRRSAVRALSPG